MSDAFSFRDVTKTYKDFRLDIPHLSLDRGYVLGLVGRNGAGKSTAIKILMNLVYPDSGEVRVLGMSQPRDDIEIKRRVGYVSEDPLFYKEMTVAWMAGLVSRYYPNWDNSLYERYLGKFGLNPKKKFKDLSRGMKVKLGLILSLSHRPELLILDEPTSGIDPVVRRELLQEISEIITDENRTVLLSSHITSDVEQVADYIAVIDRGKIVEFADKESMMNRWKRVTGTLRPNDSSGAASMFSAFKVDGVAFAGVTGAFSESWLQALKSKGAADLKVSNVGLDEVLISLAGREE